MAVLEPRRLFASATWDGGGDSVRWLDPRNWAEDRLPEKTDDVTIDLPPISQNIQLTADVLVRSIHSVRAITIWPGATLDLSAPSTGGFYIGGTLRGAAISSGGWLTVAGGSVVDCVIGSPDAPAGLGVLGSATFDRATIFAQSVEASGPFGNNGDCSILGNATIQLCHSNGFYGELTNYTWTGTIGGTLTIDKGISLLGAPISYIKSAYGGTIVNKGTIRTTAPGFMNLEAGNYYENGKLINEGEIIADGGGHISLWAEALPSGDPGVLRLGSVGSSITVSRRQEATPTIRFTHPITIPSGTELDVAGLAVFTAPVDVQGRLLLRTAREGDSVTAVAPIRVLPGGTLDLHSPTALADVSVVGGTLNFNAEGRHTGRIDATSSHIALGYQSLSDLGTISINDCDVAMGGPFDLEGGVLNITGSRWTIGGSGAIRNGTIRSSDSAFLLMTGDTSAGMLEAVVLDADCHVAGDYFGVSPLIQDIEIVQGRTLTVSKNVNVLGTIGGAGTMHVDAAGLVSHESVGYASIGPGVRLEVVGHAIFSGRWAVHTPLVADGVDIRTNTQASGAFRCDVPLVAMNGGTIALERVDAVLSEVRADETSKILLRGNVAIDSTRPTNLDASGLIVIDYAQGTSPDLARWMQAVRQGYASNWSGAGARSTRAAGDPSLGVALVDGAVAWSNVNTYIAGEWFDRSTIVLRTTFRGDVTGDGIVAFNDLQRLAMSYRNGPAGWMQGDTNFDGIVDFEDLLVMAKAYGRRFV